MILKSYKLLRRKTGGLLAILADFLLVLMKDCRCVGSVATIGL